MCTFVDSFEICVCACGVYMCVRMCVCEREEGREGGRERRVKDIGMVDKINI